MRFLILKNYILLSLIGTSIALPKVHAAEEYAPWLTQIGINDQILSAAKWGKGIKLGVVDTGVNPTSPFFSKGQISNKQSSCAAISFTCSNKFNDDHGHGTAVAVIAAGNLASPWESNYGGYLTRANSVTSVAPSANIIAQKVLNASGSAYTFDVANGIRQAANAGASVINVSISYANTQDIVSSINYAASKGAYVVWAGGNNASDLLQNASTNGLTNQALNRLVFAGSVDANNTKSSFSNTPGSGNLNATGNQLAYSQRWLMTPKYSCTIRPKPTKCMGLRDRHFNEHSNLERLTGVITIGLANFKK